MIDLSKLLSSEEIDSDSIRYSNDCSKNRAGVKKGMGPVIAWNITSKCNFKCRHCYINANKNQDSKELNTNEVKNLIDNLSSMNVPVILLSGGEPLMREDIFEVIQYIRGKNIRVSLSTNGSLITKEKARKLKDLGIGYVGISLDGTEETNDSFRGVDGAYKSIIRAIENCKEVGQKVGLRFTLSKSNYKEVNNILSLLDKMEIDRICFYHLVPSGRGHNILNEMLSHDESRYVMDILYRYVKKNVNKKDWNKEILTVANFTDGIYTYLKEKDTAQGERIITLLKNNGGNRSGTALANIDFKGDVYPDQFSRLNKLGNVTENLFSDIWNNENDALKNLRDRKGKLKGRCNECKWLDICNGNLRARAYGYYGDEWQEDPGCYLTDDEIGVSKL